MRTVSYMTKSSAQMIVYNKRCHRHNTKLGISLMVAALNHDNSIKYDKIIVKNDDIPYAKSEAQYQV